MKYVHSMFSLYHLYRRCIYCQPYLFLCSHSREEDVYIDGGCGDSRCQDCGNAKWRKHHAMTFVFFRHLPDPEQSSNLS